MNIDFFISRTGADAQSAQWIAQCLEEAGYSIILQDWDFKPGEDFILNMDRAMRSSKRTLLVLSRNYEKAQFTVPEWTHAIANDPTGERELLIPVRIDDIVPEGIFKTRVFIDLYNLNKEKAKERLLITIRSLSQRQPDVPVSFPGSITTRFPGALPPLWHIPFDRNPVFTGREQEMNSLREVFNQKIAPPINVALTGMGGVGKTALAVEYAYSFSSQYRACWWIRAEHRQTIIADLAHLADTITPDSAPALESKASYALNWLSNHDKWLLILDAADNPVLSKLAIPQGGNGHVIITSRAVNWRRYANVLPIEALSDDAGAELLKLRSGQTISPATTKLVRLVGGLPIGIEWMGAFLEQQGLDADEYLTRIRKRGNLPIDDTDLRPPDYDRALNTIWSESFKVLEKQSPVAIDLLRLSAFMSPTDIPRPLLTRGAQFLNSSLYPVAVNADDLADLVAAPRAFSLISTSGDGYSINRMVQSLIRNNLNKEKQKEWAETSVSLLNAVLPVNVTDFRLWKTVGRLISHAITASELGIEYNLQSDAVIRLLDRGATYLADTGANVKEITEKRDAVYAYAKNLPGGVPGWLINNQAVWLISQKKNAEAALLLEELIDKTRMLEGGNSISLGKYWGNLGNLYKIENDLDKSHRSLMHSIAILDTLPDYADEAKAISHGNLGEVLYMLGKRESAAVHFKIAADYYASALGPGSQEEILNRSFYAQAMGQNPNIVIQYEVTPGTIAVEEGKLFGREKLWQEDAEQLLREATQNEVAGAAVELWNLLKSQEGREDEADEILLKAASKGEKQALYWYARQMAGTEGLYAEEILKQSIDAGNIFSNYDLGLVLSTDPSRWPEAEQAFRNAINGGFEIARNDLGLLLVNWPGREHEGEILLDEGGRLGQPRCWQNLAASLRNIPGREKEAEDNFYKAARSGYLKAYGFLAYYLIEQNKLDQVVPVFKEGIAAGLIDLRQHLDQFQRDHPDVSAS